MSQKRQPVCGLPFKKTQIYACLNTNLKMRLQIGPTKNICSGKAITKFITTVCSHITGSSTLIPFCSIAPTMLISDTMLQTVNVCMHKMIKIALSCGTATLKARYFATLPATKKASKNPMSHSGKNERAA